MSGATSNTLNPQVHRALTNRNTVITGHDGATGYGNPSRVLQVNAIGIWTPTGCSNPHIPNQKIVAMVYCHVYCFAVH